MEKMVRITICIEPETERLIRLLSRRHGRSISELVREAVEYRWVKGVEPNPSTEQPPDDPESLGKADEPGSSG